MREGERVREHQRARARICTRLSSWLPPGSGQLWQLGYFWYIPSTTFSVHSTRLKLMRHVLPLPTGLPAAEVSSASLLSGSATSALQKVGGCAGSFSTPSLKVCTWPRSRGAMSSQPFKPYTRLLFSLPESV